MNAFDQTSSGSEVIKMYMRKWKVILLTVAVSAALATAAVLVLKERYRAKASFFVPFDTSLEKVIENTTIGYDIDADRVLQILNSEQLKDSVISRFRLDEYFDIDKSNPQWPQQLTDIYRKRIFFTRTNTMSIIVEAETHDPVFSAEIVTYIVDVAQRVREDLLKTNMRIAVDIFKRDYERKKQETDSLAAVISKMREKGGAAYPLLLTMSSGIVPNSDPQLEMLTQKYVFESQRLNELKGKYEKTRDVENRPITQFYMIDEPYPVYTPSFPMPGFIISTAIFGSLFFILAALYLQYVIAELRRPRN